MYQPPNQPQQDYSQWQQPNTQYPPQPPYQQPWPGPPVTPPQQRPARMNVKISSIVCFAIGLTLGMAGIPALLSIAGLLLLASFVLIFLI